MPPLRARAPLDLDLEDRLIFGLTPVRFGYLAVGCLAAFTLGAHGPGSPAWRLPLAALIAGLAAALAWLRWRGRPLDAWLLDIAVYAHRNLEVEIDPVMLRRIRAPLRRPARPRLLVSRPRIPTIAVSSTQPGAGSTTVAIELGAALALKGRRVALSQPAGGGAHSLPLTLDEAGVHARTGLRVASGALRDDSECVVVDLGTQRRHERADLALVVATSPGAVSPARHVRASHVQVIVNRDREESAPPGTGLRVPDDLSVPAAQAAGEPVILQFPRSRAALAFRRLADTVDPEHPGPWRDSSDVPPAG